MPADLFSKGSIGRAPTIPCASMRVVVRPTVQWCDPCAVSAGLYGCSSNGWARIVTDATMSTAKLVVPFSTAKVVVPLSTAKVVVPLSPAKATELHSKSALRGKW